MKPETYADKLNKLLGIDTETAEKLASDDNPLVKRKKQEEFKSQPRVYGYTDDEFHDIRIMQGTLYFLQAPELFTIKQCPVCTEWFAVSRQAVGYCSYDCMNKKFKELGMEFRKGGDLVALANDPQVWRGNEPLWTIHLSKLKKSLQVIIDSIESPSMNESEQEPSGSAIPSEQSSAPLMRL